MKTEMVHIGILREDPHNARTHSQRNLDAIKSSLDRFGQVEPLVVQREGNVVIGGNGRLRAMLDMGHTKVSVHYVDIADKAAKALGIALNRTGELAEWDQEKLVEILGELEETYLDAAWWNEAEVAVLTDRGELKALDPYEEWQKGMPEYVHGEDEPFRKIIMHFKNSEDVDSFLALIGQTATDVTKSMWHPPMEMLKVQNKRYVLDEGE